MLNFLPGLIAAGLAVCGMGFYLLCLWSARTFLRSRRQQASAIAPPVSILKPLRGVDPQMYESFRSHCVQDYPEYKIIFGENLSRITGYLRLISICKVLLRR